MVYEFNRAPMSGSTFHYDNQNAKELQRAEGYARKTTLDYVRMLYDFLAPIRHTIRGILRKKGVIVNVQVC
jgi:hypothetical protein